MALDPTGAVLTGVVVRLANQDTGAIQSATSDKDGRFNFLLLPPGKYELQASKTGSDTLIANATVDVSVTEVVHLELRLQLATVFHSIKVYAEAATVQTDSSALGKVVNETAVGGLPLVTRNFAQIASLSPGVINRSVQRRRAWTRWDRALADCQHRTMGFTCTERVPMTTISKSTE